MDHQSELEKPKYRNWVKGGLAYKYLKQGIEDFANTVVIQEHNRIIHNVIPTPGANCNQCSLRNLKPSHISSKDSSTGKTVCPWSQVKCNCLFSGKQPCPDNVCDAILEEVLNSHASTPPSPNWKNTDIQKWCCTPWEIAKCFINAPGYANITTASHIDAPGLLHVFINNKNMKTHLTCKLTGTGVLNRVLKRRNAIFHSPTMELDGEELSELIDDVIEILEDEKELKANNDAINAVKKLRQLKDDTFTITTHNEHEVNRDAIASVETLRQTLKDQAAQTIDNASIEIDTKRSQAIKLIDDKTEDAKKAIDEKKSMATRFIDDKLEKVNKEIDTKKAHADKCITDKTEKAIKDIDTKTKEASKSFHDISEQTNTQFKLTRQSTLCPIVISAFQCLKTVVNSFAGFLTPKLNAWVSRNC